MTPTEQPQDSTPELPRFLLSYAYDVPHYADFVVEAQDEEHALAIAQALLADVLPGILDDEAEPCFENAKGERVFLHDGEQSDNEHYQTLPEIIDRKNVDRATRYALPEGWQDMKPAPSETAQDDERPTYAALLEALRDLVAECDTYTEEDKAELPDTAFASSLIAKADAAAE